MSCYLKFVQFGEHVMRKCLLALPILLIGCVETDIQPLTQTSFQVSSSSSDCSLSDAREIANTAAAIEVIRRGGDRFIYASSQSDTSFGGLYYNDFVGLQSYNTNQQMLVVQMLSPGDPGYDNALSARNLLGPDWRTRVQEGAPQSCLDG